MLFPIVDGKTLLKDIPKRRDLPEVLTLGITLSTDSPLTFRTRALNQENRHLKEQVSGYLDLQRKHQELMESTALLNATGETKQPSTVSGHLPIRAPDHGELGPLESYHDAEQDGISLRLRATIEALLEEKARLEKEYEDEVAEAEDLTAEKELQRNFTNTAKKLSGAMAQLCLRILLEKERLKIKNESLGNLRDELNDENLSFPDEALKTRISRQFELPRNVVALIYDYNKLRRIDNMAAHTAPEDDVWGAVTSIPSDLDDRIHLEEVFEFVHGSY